MENPQKTKNRPQSVDKLQEINLRILHWRRTTLLTATMVGLAIFVVLGTPLMTALDFQFKLFGFSLGYFFIAQGAIIIIIAAVFMFSLSQDKIDRESLMGEHY